jgi:hypothetical protein
MRRNARRYATDVTKKNSHRLTSDEERKLHEAEQRLDVLRRDAQGAHAEGRLAEVIRDTPSVHQQLESFLDA